MGFGRHGNQRLSKKSTWDERLAAHGVARQQLEDVRPGVGRDMAPNSERQRDFLRKSPPSTNGKIDSREDSLGVLLFTSSSQQRAYELHHVEKHCSPTSWKNSSSERSSLEEVVSRIKAVPEKGKRGGTHDDFQTQEVLNAH